MVSIKWKLNKLLYKASHVVSKIYDHFSGLDFDMRFDSMEEHGSPYEATTFLAFKNLRRYLRRQEGEISVIDIGCGKGKMLYFFARTGCTKIGGLEYSKELAEIARQNIKKLSGRGKMDDNHTDIIVGDASLYSNYSQYNYFYLYNPFDEIIMEQFLTRLLENVKRKPRSIHLIYVNPKWSDLLLAYGFEQEEEFYYRTKVFIYKIGEVGVKT